VNPYYFPMEYRGFVFNAHRSAAGVEVPAFIADTARVQSFDPTRLQQRDQREALHLLTGGDLGDATLVFRYISLSGILKASTGAKLSDQIAAMEAAFDVEEAQRASPATEGVLPFTFTDTTEVVTGRGVAWTDPVTGLGDGQYVKERFMARPAGFPILPGRRSGGDSVTFACELVCPDPRRYIDTAESVVLNGANGFAANCPNWTAAQGVAVFPLVTIVMSGAGSAGLTIDLGDVASLSLNMAGETAGTFTWDTATGIIKKGATHRADLRNTAASTLFGYISAGGNAAAAGNTTNVTSITIAYRQARR